MARLGRIGTALALLVAGPLAADGPTVPSADELTVEWIFSEEAEDALGGATSAAWNEDGTVLLLDGARPRAERTLERVDPKSLSREVLVDPEKALKSLEEALAEDDRPEQLAWPETTDGAGRQAIYAYAGDLYLLRLDRSSRFERLTTTEAAESVPRLSPDGRRLAFVRDHDLWIRELEGGAETRVTSDGSDTVLNGTLSWVYWEEIFDHEGGGIFWAPDSSAIAFLRSDESPVAVSTFVDIEPETPRVHHQRYPKVGGTNPLVTLGVHDLESGRTSWLDRSEVAYEYLMGIGWAAASQALGVETLDRSQDRADLYLVARDGSARRVWTATDPAWVNRIDWHLLADGRSFVVNSQETGHNHLYRQAVDGERLSVLTAGDWSVRGPENWQGSTIASTVDDTNGLVYFTARRPDLTQIQLYRTTLDGGDPVRLSSEPGVHRVDWSEDRRYYLDWHSSHERPPVLDLRDASGARRATLSEVPAAALAKLDILPPDLLTVPAADGYPLQARLYKPRDFDPTRPYPLLLYVYGEPNAPQIKDARGVWPQPATGLFERILLREGFLVGAVDTRIATGETKAMENLAHRHVSSTTEIADLEAAIRWFKAQPWVDPERVGMWGKSGGGTTTLMMLTRSTELRAGISIAGLTDRRFYDTKYAEAYMETPAENPDGYDEVSLVPRAKDLHGDLLLIHGTADDNVHPQSAWRFVDGLVEAGIPFEMMIYPRRDHSLRDRPVRKHWYSLMLDFWKRKLGAPRPDPEAATAPPAGEGG